MNTNATDAPVDLPLLPVRMLNEFSYCPRLGYLEWVQGEFADSADTVEGRYRHRRVDQGMKRPAKKESEGEEEKVILHARSVSLSSERMGLTAKIDLVEGDGARVTHRNALHCHLEPGEGLEDMSAHRGDRDQIPTALFQFQRTLTTLEHRFRSARHGQIDAF